MTCKIDERIYTHKRRARHATAVQFTEHNAEQIIQLMRDIGSTAEMYKGATDMILVRNRVPDGLNPAVYTLYVGDWLVKGENGATKRYSDSQFKIKYEEI